MEQTQDTHNSSSVSLTDILWLSLSKWYLFVISLLICCGAAFYYTLRTPNVYQRHAKLLIKDDQITGTPGGDVGASFAGMAVLQANSNVVNEVVAISSPVLMYEVADRLNLDVNYVRDGLFHDETLYGSNLPVQLRFVDLQDSEKTAMTMNVNADGSGTLTDIVTGFDADGAPVYSSETVRFPAGVDTIKSPVGRILVRPNAKFTSSDRTVSDIHVVRTPKTDVARDLSSRLKAAINDQYSSIIELTFDDISGERATDFLATTIEVYNENWVRDKNQIAVSTSNFINERLQVIEQELGNVDTDISSYRSEHMLPDVQQVAQAYFQRTNEASDEVQAINNKLAVAKYVREFLSNSANNSTVLPANVGLADINIESQISAYNAKLLQRNNLLENSSSNNPLIVSLDNDLSGMRQSILAAIDNYITTLNASLRTAQTAQATSASRLAANPSQAKYLLSVERQQKVKESLYLYLLQKREENELSQAFTAYNTRVITPPTGSDVPISPNRRNIMLIAILIGLAIPFGLLYLSETMNTRVRGRRDLEGLSLPFVGEIPLGYRRRSRLRRLFGGGKQVEPRRILVRKGSGNIINEAFRVIRTNLEFMTELETSEQGLAHTIMITSANPGSGKTFVSLNLGAVLAIKGKRVCLIDLDLRKASLSQFAQAGNVGVSSYLIGQSSIDQIIMRDLEGYEGLDVVPVGAIPPNPSELLYSPRLKTLLDKLKHDYDYVLIDCPPVEVVADAKIVNPQVDMTIFVVRAGLLERDMLGTVQRFYDTHRYRNLAILLNGTDSAGIGSAYRRYGYGYGYTYGYGNKQKDEE